MRIKTNKSSQTKTEYKCVYFIKTLFNGKYERQWFKYNFYFNGNHYQASKFSTARDAAKAMDLKLIEIGEQPRHILKSKEK